MLIYLPWTTQAACVAPYLMFDKISLPLFYLKGRSSVASETVVLTRVHRNARVSYFMGTGSAVKENSGHWRLVSKLNWWLVIHDVSTMAHRRNVGTPSGLILELYYICYFTSFYYTFFARSYTLGLLEKATSATSNRKSPLPCKSPRILQFMCTAAVTANFLSLPMRLILYELKNVLRYLQQLGNGF
jgi:hypothetical protein